MAQRLKEQIGIDDVPKILRRIPQEPMRIVSIDMGIRNLAYCVLDVQPSRNPTLEAWKKIAVSSAPKAQLKPAGDESVAEKAMELDEKALLKESFEPGVLSRTAYNFIKETIIPFKPSHVLIERQRFRSTGNSQILEWTVRVNVFECMIYAVLQSLRAESLWQGQIIPIAPGKVGPFWLEEEGLAYSEDDAASQIISKVRKSKLAKIHNKGKKIDLVQHWLSSGKKVELGTPEVQELARSYHEKWNRKSGRRAKAIDAVDPGTDAGGMGKLDDLADSLLQGMAFVQWEENKRAIRELGVNAFLESCNATGSRK